MSTLNANPDASDTTTPTTDGLCAPMSPSNDVPSSTPGLSAESAASSQWAEGLRCTVRDNPLAAVAAAAALGMVMARLVR